MNVLYLQIISLIITEFWILKLQYIYFNIFYSHPATQSRHSECCFPKSSVSTSFTMAVHFIINNNAICRQLSTLRKIYLMYITFKIMIWIKLWDFFRDLKTLWVTIHVINNTKQIYLVQVAGNHITLCSRVGEWKWKGGMERESEKRVAPEIFWREWESERLC
jgi:hypothetical protein